jgi:hypothetical protein
VLDVSEDKTRSLMRNPTKFPPYSKQMQAWFRSGGFDVTPQISGGSLGKEFAV